MCSSSTVTLFMGGVLEEEDDEEDDEDNADDDALRFFLFSGTLSSFRSSMASRAGASSIANGSSVVGLRFFFAWVRRSSR